MEISSLRESQILWKQINHIRSVSKSPRMVSLLHEKMVKTTSMRSRQVPRVRIESEHSHWLCRHELRTDFSTTHKHFFFIYFYYKLGDRLWGPMGFYDGFSLHKAWFATSTLAIDQGPILIRIENHRTRLLHDLLMNAPEVQAGMKGLGFTSPYF